MAAAEAASAVAAITTAAAARFGHAGRGSDDNRRSKCSFDCKCRDIHLCTHDLRKAPVDQSCFARLVPLCARAPQVIRQFAATDSSFKRSRSIIRTTYSISTKRNEQSDGVRI
jgi:hypothetical protein